MQEIICFRQIQDCLEPNWGSKPGPGIGPKCGYRHWGPGLLIALREDPFQARLLAPTMGPRMGT